MVERTDRPLGFAARVVEERAMSFPCPQRDGSDFLKPVKDLKKEEKQQQFLSKKQRSGILQKLKSFGHPNVSITNCIFEDDYVEFYFVLEGISSIDKSKLVEEMTTFLDVGPSLAGKVRLTQLKSKPVRERTCDEPGDALINLRAQKATTLGAIVSIEEKGEHVISCGHDKQVGDILSNIDGQRIGETKAVLHFNEADQTYDAAVATVDTKSYRKAVKTQGGRLNLSANPVEPTRGTVVQRYPPNPLAPRATITSTHYNCLGDGDDLYGCIAVRTDNGTAFHAPGESGLLITSAESQLTVDPIGMLIAIEMWGKTDNTSLAISFKKNLDKLQEGEYCDGRQISFLNEKMPLNSRLQSGHMNVMMASILSISLFITE